LNRLFLDKRDDEPKLSKRCGKQVKVKYIKLVYTIDDDIKNMSRLWLVWIRLWIFRLVSSDCNYYRVVLFCLSISKHSKYLQNFYPCSWCKRSPEISWGY